MVAESLTAEAWWPTVIRAEAVAPLELDDLTKIEGIGPKIAEHLNSAGIGSFSALATVTPEELRGILDAVGGFAAHDPSTWPDQARLAASGEWDKLSEWQDALDGGRIVAEPDDLTKIEGIGPKIAELLVNQGSRISLSCPQSARTGFAKFWQPKVELSPLVTPQLGPIRPNLRRPANGTS